MVDFQSRDTRRGPTDGDDTDEDDDADEEAATTDSGPTADTSTERSSTDGEPATDRTDAEQSTNAAASADSGRAQTRQVAVAVVTVGTATEAGDPTGEAVTAALADTGQTVVATERLRGDYDGIQQTVDRLAGRDDVEVVVTAGGLGVGPTEHALEAVHPLFEKALPGFEEVYRSLLFERRGTGVVRVRATAGIADGTPVFCLPADPATARVAIDEIIAAEAGALVGELT